MTGSNADVAPADPAGTVFPWLFGADRSAQIRRLLFIVLVPATVLISTLTFDFLLDDNLVVLNDPSGAETTSMGAVFGQPVRILDVTLGFFRPLVALSYRTDRLLWGLNPAGYHLTNLLWHLFVTLLLYRVALRTLGNPTAAWLAAILFAVLPVHTEAVAWIQGRVDLIPTGLVLLALLALLRARECAGLSAWHWTAVGGLAFFGALLAKESAITFPLAWGTWECGALKRHTWRGLLPGVLGRVAGLAVAGISYAVLRKVAIGAPNASWGASSLSPLGRLTGILAMLGEYGRRLCFSELPLTLFRGLPVTPPAASVVLGLLTCTLLGCGFVYAWKRHRRLFPWVAWVPITLVPPLLFVVFAYIPGTPLLVADRYLYLPSVGWCIVVGCVLAGFLNQSVAVPSHTWRLAIVGTLLSGFAALTMVSLPTWRDPVEFLEVARRQPDLSVWVRTVLNDNLGLLYLERGDFDRARAQFLVAARLSPGAASPRNNMGVLLIREGRAAEAKPWLAAAIRLNPAMASSYGNLGAAYEALGDLPAARAAFAEGLRIAPGSAWLTQGLARTAPRGDGPAVRERIP